MTQNRLVQQATQARRRGKPFGHGFTQEAAPAPPRPPEPVRPEVFYDALDSLVGQDSLRTKLASCFFQYTLYLNQPEARQPNMLVYGRSGSGKTYAVMECLQAASIPGTFIMASTIVSAAGLAPPGYRGRVIIDVLIDHWRRHKTDYGVIFVDEVDKLCSGAFSQVGAQRGLAQNTKTTSELEIGGRAMQYELLKFVEGELVSFTDDAKDIEELEGVTFDTANIFWIFAGAFGGIDRLVRSRLHNHHLQEEDAWEFAIPIDFKRYGMTDEFADRVGTWAWTKPLKTVQMMDILRQQDRPRWIMRFKAIGCELDLQDGALGACAQHAWEMKEGPRVARAMLNRGMDDILAEASRARAKMVAVNAENVRSGRVSFGS